MMITSSMAGIALTAASASFIASALILATVRWHGIHSLDSDMAGAQKFHKSPVPRVGGVSLLLGMVAAFFMLSAGTVSGSLTESANMVARLLLAATPVFVAGLVEDLTKRVSVGSRLLAAFASPLLASGLLGATLPRMDIWGLDVLFLFAPAALVITAIAVAGVINSINIVDGFNGLAAFTSIIILTALGIVSWEAGDFLLVQLAMIGIGAVAGFLIFNYPAGRLFMGDSGAYLLGFWIAEIAVLIIVRNPAVSAWQVLAVCAYPVIEVMYSIYRRKIIRKMSPGMPDRLHLHSLVYRRLVCRILPGQAIQPWQRNATTTLVLALFILPFSMMAALWGDRTAGALVLLVAQVFCYLAIYARLVRGHWCLNPAVGFGFRPERRSRSTT